MWKYNLWTWVYSHPTFFMHSKHWTCSCCITGDLEGCLCRDRLFPGIPVCEVGTFDGNCYSWMYSVFHSWSIWQVRWSEAAFKFLSLMWLTHSRALENAGRNLRWTPQSVLWEEVGAWLATFSSNVFHDTDLIRVKVKCTFVQTLRLCTGHMAHRGSRGIALLFYDHSTRRGEGSASRPGRSLPQGKTRYPFYWMLGGPQGWSGQVWKVSPPTGIRSLDRPACSQSLYWLRYPAHYWLDTTLLNTAVPFCALVCRPLKQLLYTLI